MALATISTRTGITDTVLQQSAGQLERVIGDPEQIRAVKHPMGFVCFPIERNETSGTCVHMWTTDLPTATLTTSPVHSHSWDLESLVVWGELVNELYIVHNDAPTHRLYEVHSGTIADELTATQHLLRCERIDDHHLRAGVTYQLTSGRYHASSSDGAITVVIGTGQPGAVDRVLGAIDGQTHLVHRERYSPDETVTAARMALRRLQELPSI